MNITLKCTHVSTHACGCENRVNVNLLGVDKKELLDKLTDTVTLREILKLFDKATVIEETEKL